MDSMRSLNTSLPRATAQQQNQPSSELLSSFKAAALSVTTLYKVAAADQARARAAGYQDALEDLLSFMERDRIGFTDGEGSRIRQWTIERVDGNHAARQDSEDDEEETVEEDKHRASSPDDLLRSNRMDQTARDPLPETNCHNAQTARDTDAPPIPQPHQQEFAVPKDQSSFSFRSNHSYPSNHDREASADGPDQSSHAHKPSTSQPMRLEFVPRPNRHRPSRSSTARSSASLPRHLGAGAGSKRRLPLSDFFDIGSLGIDPKDFEKPFGKRARHS